MARTVRISRLATLVTWLAFCARADWNPLYTVEASGDVDQLKGEIDALVTRLSQLEQKENQKMQELQMLFETLIDQKSKPESDESPKVKDGWSDENVGSLKEDPDESFASKSGGQETLSKNDQTWNRLTEFEKTLKELKTKINSEEQQEKTWKEEIDTHINFLNEKVAGNENAIGEINLDLANLNTTLHARITRRSVRDVSSPSKTTDIEKSLARLENMVTSLISRVTLLEKSSSIARASKHEEEFRRLKEEAEVIKTNNS